MTRVALAVTAIALHAIGCRPAARGPARPRPSPHGAGAVADVEGAALPYHVLRGRGGQEVPAETFFTELAAARAVCVGESHDNPHHHWAQLMLLDRLSTPGNGHDVGLGLEMFQRPFQGVLDDFAAGRISEGDLLARSGWKQRWGYDFGLYRPMIGLAVKRGLPVLALNAPEELTKKVARQGLDALSPEERGQVPELVLDDAAHRAFFDEATEGHGDASGGNDNYYVAQVIWDETMADTAATWLAAGERRQAVILAGTGHCIDSAIPARIRRRGIDGVVSVRPIIDDGEGNVAEALAKPENDFVLVMAPHD